MADDSTSAMAARKPKPRDGKNKVRLVTHPSAEASETGLGKTVFEHEDEGAARIYIEQHHPRGREVVLQTGSGDIQHFSADLKAQGDENGGWQDFDDEELTS